MTTQKSLRRNCCRQKLIRRFSAERCYDAEDLASETLERVLTALDNDPHRVSTQIEAFISSFATMIVHESHRRPVLKEDPPDDLAPANEPGTSPMEDLLKHAYRISSIAQCSG